MNKRGFTLVELLAVIAILAIILGLVVVNVVHFSNNRREKDYNNIVSIIEKNADVLVNTDDDMYDAVNNKLVQINDACKIEYQRLEDSKLMDEGTVNPLTGKSINKDSYIKVILNDEYEFEYTFIDKDKKTDNEAIDSCLSTN